MLVVMVVVIIVVVVVMNCSLMIYCCSNSKLGTGESFLFSLSPEFHVYKWTKVNDFFQFGENNFISIGGGSASSNAMKLRKSPSTNLSRNSSSESIGNGSGQYGLWLDLVAGTSSTCETYLNRPLGSNQDFEVIVLELWTFV